MYDFIIIGGGLAGSILSYRLMNEGAKVIILDEPERNISTRVAAGIFNPITGKRSVLTWKAKEMFDELHSFYPKIEQELGAFFFKSMPVYRMFDSVFEQNEWLSKIQDNNFNNFILPEITFLKNGLVNNPFGAMQIEQAGRLDCKLFLDTAHYWLAQKNGVSYRHFDFSKVSITNEIIKYEELKSEAIIFCEGNYAIENRYFNFLPHKPVHGELLEIEIPDFYTDRIINKGVFILPLGNDKYLAGSTYNWDLTVPVTTRTGKNEIENKLKALINKNYKITGHWAGIRPSTLDRRPYMGRHPEFKNLFIFNGFGSKGVSLIPYLSKQFTNYLLNDAQLPREADICRVKGFENLKI